MNSASSDTQSYYPIDNVPPNWSPEPVNTFVPTAVQRERVNALKQFDRWMVYVPLGLLAAAVLGVVIYLLIIAIWPPYEDTRLFLSGVADIIMILFMLPVVLIFGLLLVGLIGGFAYWRQSRNNDNVPPLQKEYGRLRLLLWKVDQKLSGVYQQADQMLPMVANPVIRFNAVLAYINAWLAQLTKRLNRHHAE